MTVKALWSDNVSINIVVGVGLGSGTGSNIATLATASFCAVLKGEDDQESSNDNRNSTLSLQNDPLTCV